MVELVARAGCSREGDGFAVGVCAAACHGAAFFG